MGQWEELRVETSNLKPEIIALTKEMTKNNATHNPKDLLKSIKDIKLRKLPKVIANGNDDVKNIFLNQEMPQYNSFLFNHTKYINDTVKQNPNLFDLISTVVGKYKPQFQKFTSILNIVAKSCDACALILKGTEITMKVINEIAVSKGEEPVFSEQAINGVNAAATGFSIGGAILELIGYTIRLFL